MSAPSDLIGVEVMGRSQKMIATRAQRLQDRVHLIPSPVPRGRISKHHPTNISASAGQSLRIQAPCPQLINSARIFKIRSPHMDFYSQVSAGISFPSDQRRKVTTLSQDYSQQWCISLDRLWMAHPNLPSQMSELSLQWYKCLITLWQSITPWINSIYPAGFSQIQML